jgi:hypothetical protein
VRPLPQHNKTKCYKKLIEEYIPRWDLTHVIDTSGAYIPGHGTPTVTQPDSSSGHDSHGNGNQGRTGYSA